MRVIICKIPIIMQDTNFISQTVGQTNFYPPTLQSACPKTIMQGFSSVFVSSSSWSKTTLCIFKEKIWLPNRKCYGKDKLYFDQEEIGNAMEKK